MTIHFKSSLIKKKKRNYLEGAHQASFFDWLDAKHPSVSILCFHPANEGKRSYIYGKMLKKQGMRAGVPDVFCAIPHSVAGVHYPGLFIEFKAGKNKLTEKQAQFKDAVMKAGYRHETVYSVDEAIQAFSIMNFCINERA